jgi:long-chain acyl-CoA synthetase
LSDEPRTLCEMFQLGLRRHERRAAFLRKADGAYRPVSSAEFGDRVQAVASGLRSLGLQPGDRVALLSENRLEWAVADYAILHCGAVTVPIYPTLQASVVQAQVTDCGAVAAFVADPSQLAKLGDAAALPALRHVFLFEGEPPAAAASASGRAVHALRELDARGLATHDPEAFERTWRRVRPEDLATLIYTSGTSGASKGVMLTHANLIANIVATLRRVPMLATDTCLSFLPLSHVLERMAGHFVMWHVGATIAYAESVDRVPQNLLEIRPTVLISVPRLYEKMNARMLAAVAAAPPLRRRLFAWAQDVGRARVHLEQRGAPVPPALAWRSRLADLLVFRKLRHRLGGRMRIMISGGAPLSHSIAEFFHAAGLPILEGYGLTETSPVLCVNPPERPRIGTVGPPLDNVEIRIAPDGEILARGPSVLFAYWNHPQATQEALAGGWFHTGDIGAFDADGYLRITDRLKDILVTTGGKKVAPQPIESRLKAFQHLSEAILVGDHRKYVAALVIPNFPNLEAWAHAHRVPFGSHAELVRAPAVLRLFELVLGEVNSELASFERVKRFRLLDRELHLQDGEITASMKVRRSVIATRFAEVIESMYAEPPGPGVGCPPTGEATESDPATAETLSVPDGRSA